MRHLVSAPFLTLRCLFALGCQQERKERSRWAHGPGALNGEQRPEAGAEYSESQEPTDDQGGEVKRACNG